MSDLAATLESLVLSQGQKILTGRLGSGPGGASVDRIPCPALIKASEDDLALIPCPRVPRLACAKVRVTKPEGQLQFLPDILHKV
jgi:hypothetical protein